MRRRVTTAFPARAIATVSIVTAAAASPAIADARVLERVAVFAVVEDPNSAGVLERAIEAEVSRIPMEVRQGSEIAATLNGRDDRAVGTPLDEYDRKELAALLARARRAYVSDQLAGALDHLAEAQDLFEGRQASSEDRIRVHLLRAAVFLEMGERARATSEAREILTRDPDYSVNLDEFRPSLAELVDRVRAESGRTFAVRLSNVPRGASIFVDERPVGASTLQVTGGRHRLEVRAPGFRSVSLDLEGTPGSAVAVHLAVALSQGNRRALTDGAWRKRPPALSRWRLAFLARRLGVTHLVVVADREGERRAAIWHKGKVAVSGSEWPDADGDARLKAWIVHRLKSDPFAEVDGEPAPPARAPAVSSPTTASSPHREAASGSPPASGAAPDAASSPPAPVASALPPASERPASGGWTLRWPRGWEARLAATGGWRERRERLRGVDGGGIATWFGGATTQVEVEVARDAWIGSLDLAWSQYGLRAAEVEAERARPRVRGGSASEGRVAAGYERRFGGATGASPRVVGWTGIAWERHRARDVRDAAGAIGLLPSRSVVGWELGAEGSASLPAIPNAPTRLSAGIVFAPWISWRERPDGARGSGVESARGSGFELAAEWERPDGWILRAGYDYRERHVRYGGVGEARIEPALREARHRDERHTLAVSVRRVF